MTMRITGLSSGLDTDSMVQELVSASSAKKESYEKAQTKLEWKQETWKDLNAKVYSFFNKQLSNLKYEGSYIKKKTTIADSAIASVLGGDTAVNGTQTLSVKQLASTGYLTSGKLSNDKSVKSTTTLSELAKKAGKTLNESDTFSFTIKTGGKETLVELKGSATVSDVLNKMKEAGLTANFDEQNQRIFISASDSGAENDFHLIGEDISGLNALASMGLLTKEDISDTSSDMYQEYSYWAGAYVKDADNNYVLDETIFAQKLAEEAKTTAQQMTDRLQEMQDTVTSLLEKRKSLTSGESLLENQKKSEEAQKELAETASMLKAYYLKMSTSDTATEEEIATAKENLGKAREAYEMVSDAAEELGIDLPEQASTTLEKKVESESRAFAAVANEVINKGALNGISADAVRVKGQDAVISLNGAEFTSNTNNFSINGLTIMANSVSAVTGTDAAGNKIYATTNITTADDVDGIYDTIKNFLKEYNALIKEMDTLYNAESAKDYEPLTSEEKDSLSEEEVEKWETKIKDALLRRDGDLNTLISSFKMTMLSSYEVNGKKYSLSSFGISTLGYFLSGENEKGVYHIDGDEDDDNTSSNTDKLKAAIASDPQSVVGFFTQLITDFQSKLDNIMARTDYRSRYKVYDDKRLQTEYDDYTKKIKDQEEKLADLEDRYYDQFATMEKAMSNLSSQQNYISSLFGS